MYCVRPSTRRAIHINTLASSALCVWCISSLISFCAETKDLWYIRYRFALQSDNAWVSLTEDAWALGGGHAVVPSALQRLHYNACITRFLPERRSIRPGRGPEPAEVFWDVGDGEDPPGRLPGPENLRGLL